CEYLHRDVILGHGIPSKHGVERGFEKKPDRIIENEILFDRTRAAILKKDTERTEAAIMHERVSPEDDILRIHYRRTRDVVVENIILEQIVVRVHKVQAVP